MKKGKLKFTNETGKEITLFLEPEGTPYVLKENDSITLEPVSEGDDCEINISSDASGLSLTVWPQTGGYVVSD